MKSGGKQAVIREAVGVFLDADHLKEAVAELIDAGFDRERLGLLASEHAVRQSLGDFYVRADSDETSPQAPAIAFIGREAMPEEPKTMSGSLFFVGTSGVLGAVVASSAVLGGALFAALGGAVAVGAVGALVASIIHQSDADYLQQQVDEGRLLLFVRLPDSAQEQQALDILSRHCGTDVRVHEVPLKHDPTQARAG